MTGQPIPFFRDRTNFKIPPENILNFAVKEIKVITNENIGAFGYRNGALSIFPQGKTGHFQVCGLLLYPAGIREYQLGVLLQPRILVINELESGELVEILAKFKPDASPVNLLYKSRNEISLKVRLFIDFIEQRIALAH